MHGFPEGYFVIKGLASNGRCLDVESDGFEDGTPVNLWPEKENSLVESLRDPKANNQVYFIDTAGCLSDRNSGHAIDVEDGKLVLRHRRPHADPPNAYSHPLPQFHYDSTTGYITVSGVFSHRPNAQNVRYLLHSIPERKPRTFVDDLASTIAAPFFFFSNVAQKATPQEVFESGIDLKEEEMLERDLDEEGEVDDSPQRNRRVGVSGLSEEQEAALTTAAKARRRFQVSALRTTKALTGSGHA